ncbi:hypothetical protein BDA99DRAFT_533326 [Phascolomyces articulosus]|uniref:Uncharacterized protein n=1 Tax=Phascolomyces articulosus TaxID=60185 RepID=A0AAD5KLL0_9FUNG|nr:hypothetical protein BDA99DRAFT_533326 [Phascolomyces articulosus]
MFFQASYFFVNRRVILALRNSTTSKQTVQQQQQQQRKKKSVRFSGVDTVSYTHSATEYDRSYQIQKQQQQTIMKPTVMTTHRFTSPSAFTTSTTTTQQNPSMVNSPMKKPRNKLRINTQLNTAGPLFFTQLSTNYGRHCKSSHQERNVLLAAC